MYRHLAHRDRPQEGRKGLRAARPVPPPDPGAVGQHLHDVGMDTQDPIQQLRAKARAMRPFAPEVANAYDDAADIAERYVEESQNALLNLTQAARESGFSPDTIRRHLATGRIQNHGGPHRPRIKRGDLPRRAGQAGPLQTTPGHSFAAQVLRHRGILTSPDE